MSAINEMKVLLMIAGYQERTNEDLVMCWIGYKDPNSYYQIFISIPEHPQHPCMNMGHRNIDHDPEGKIGDNRPINEETIYYLECFLTGDL